MLELKIFLPLPPSKNVRKSSVTYFCKRRKKHVNMQLVSKETKAYQLWVASIFKRAMPVTVFTDKVDTRIICDWKVPDMRKDILNYHDDLSDVVQAGIGVNDRYFLFWDRSRSIQEKTIMPGVFVTILQGHDKDKARWCTCKK